MMRRLLLTAAVFGFGLPAHAQVVQKTKANVASGGKVSNGNHQVLHATGSGMATNKVSGGGVVAYLGIIGPRRNGEIDRIPPSLEPRPENTTVNVGANCRVTLSLPALEVRDNRDQNPRITYTLRGPIAADIDPGGEDVEVGLGSYDVVITVQDASGNTTRHTWRIEVVDGTAPTFDEVPDPTPEGEEQEAQSPAGTRVPFAIECSDNCSQNPRKVLDPNRARYDVGDTPVEATCTDNAGNSVQEVITIRVRDTQAPAIAGELAEEINANCETPEGAEINVPAVVWTDNATNAGDLDVILILNPGPNQQVFEDIPEAITLPKGQHLLRYAATDGADNTGRADLAVNIIDNSVPRIAVIQGPEGGWHNADGNVTVVLEVTDGCSESEDVSLNVEPAPVSVVANGNRRTLEYGQEGIYRLVMTAEDPDGNVTRNNAVGFGIDRTPPAALVASPNQGGVDEGDTETWPIFPMGEALAIDFGGEEDADGAFSGVRSVRIVVDAGEENERVVANVTFEGNGTPPRGNRLERNVGCQDANTGFCDEAERLILRKIGRGPKVLQITVTDLAGNTSVTEARLNNVTLFDGIGILQPDLQAIRGVGGAHVNRTQAALVQLVNGRGMAQLEMEASPYDTPLFLGGALQFVQNATIHLAGASDVAAEAVADDIDEVLHFLQRLARSDVAMYSAWAAEEQVNRPGWLQAAFDTDQEFVVDALSELDDALDAGQWSQAISNALLGYFHAKMAQSGWVMNYAFTPDPFDRPSVLEEYDRGLAILTDIRDELSLYLTLDGPAGEANIAEIRDRLDTVIPELEKLVEHDFVDPRLNNEDGITDEEYVNALIALRDAANFSSAAGNQGAYVRAYQYSEMQIVRWMTKASVDSAPAVQGGGRDEWPIYTTGEAKITAGVELLDERRVQGVIDLYGTDVEVGCLIPAVYHCDYIRDEGDDDEDNPLDVEDIPDICWTKMFRPGEWDDLPDTVANEGEVAVVPQCYWGDANAIRDREL